jgi:dienelactone hydrolase
VSDALFDRADAEPLDLWVGPAAPPARMAGARGLRFEFASRGDRVPGRVILPPEGGGVRPPVILLQHGAGGSKESEYLDVAAAPWVARGAALVTLDFPLHGERANPKLARFLGAGAPTPGDDALRVEFARQAVNDLRRALDALAKIEALDAARVAYAGFSLGALVGALFCALDPRPRAAALALGGGGFGPPAVDPARFVARIAPRPVLFVNARGDETLPRAAAEALHAAAAPPKQVAWFDGGHSTLPGAALKTMWQFLARQLDLR